MTNHDQTILHQWRPIQTKQNHQEQFGRSIPYLAQLGTFLPTGTHLDQSGAILTTTYSVLKYI